MSVMTTNRRKAAGVAALVLSGWLAGDAGAQTPTMESGEHLTGATLAATFSGATLAGVNSYGNSYTVSLGAGGALDGVAGANGEYVDSGRWWIKDDLFCRQWTTWLGGTEDCFVAVRDGDRIHWFHVDGEFVATETLR